MSDELRQRVEGFQRIAIGCALAGGAACLVGVFTNRPHFFISYLFAWLFWLGMSMGCFLLAMIHHLTGGRWGDVTRRIDEAGYMALPIMALLFIPIFFGLHQLYPWARPNEVARDVILQKRHVYSNIPGYVLRSVVLLGLWTAMACRLRQLSLQQDHTTDLSPTRKARVLSGAGVVIYPITGTFAYVDWVLSLEPRWFSTMFPIIIFAGQILTALTFSVIVLAWLKIFEPLRDVVREMNLYQLGNLMLAFVMFWAYVCFGQLLIIYSGNLPPEISWYLHRIAGGWEWLIIGIACTHFFIPFYLLLFRPLKKNPRTVASIAAIVLVTSPLVMFWDIKPTFFPHGFELHWLDFAAFIGLGGIWIAMFIGGLIRHPLLLRNDPRLRYEGATHAA
jgi:hypothetical protein